MYWATVRPPSNIGDSFSGADEDKIKAARPASSIFPGTAVEPPIAPLLLQAGPAPLCSPPQRDPIVAPPSTPTGPGRAGPGCGQPTVRVTV
jgi:hypothetical protein